MALTTLPTAAFANGSISTAKLADDAVSTAKLADDAVDNTKLNLADNYAFTGTVTGAGITRTRYYLTSSGTFTVPSGVTEITVMCVGGGGNGGSATSTDAGATGGGGGGLALGVISVTGGQEISYTIGGVAGTSSFGAYLTATGGSNGAQSNTSTQPNWNFTSGGVASGGSIVNIKGGNGMGGGWNNGTSTAYSGNGGCPIGSPVDVTYDYYADVGVTWSNIAGPLNSWQYGQAGVGSVQSGSLAGTDAVGYGCGGGGGATDTASDAPGGDGTQGIIIVEI